MGRRMPSPVCGIQGDGATARIVRIARGDSFYSCSKPWAPGLGGLLVKADMRGSCAPGPTRFLGRVGQAPGRTEGGDCRSGLELIWISWIGPDKG